MKYPVAVWNTDGVYTAEVPDLPGVITEADSIAELENSVKEAAAGWMECELDASNDIPLPTSVENHMDNPDYKDCLWLLCEFSMDAISDKAERVNITLPTRVLRRLDYLAHTAGDSRSGYIARMVVSQRA